MDTFFHGAVGSLIANKSNIQYDKKKLILWSILFGMLPDIIAFTPGIIIAIISGQPIHNHDTNINLALNIYNYTHSLVIAGMLFLLATVFSRRWPTIPLLAWVAHIIVDIPTHTADFFPTPFLFPISDIRFQHGIHWSTPWIFFPLWLIVITLLAIEHLKNRKNNQ